MDRNIRLAYVLTFLKHSWFWLGTWVFYYLLYTNYAGIGIVETMMILTMTVFEIPTGAIADLLGKKNTLIVSFILQTLGNFIMGFALNFNHILLSVFILSVGGTLYSGTMEALVYDSLKQSQKETLFDKIISRVNSIRLIAIVIAGALSGIIYSVHPSLPYHLVGIFNLIGLILCCFITEPSVDTEKFSFNVYLTQTRQGFVTLLSSRLRPVAILLLTLGGILTISDEMGESLLAVNLGFSPQYIGSFFAFIFLIASLVSLFTPHLSRSKKPLSIVFILGLIAAATFAVSPFVGLIFGISTMIVREISSTLISNFNSIIINRLSESRYRATTISTFNMLKNLPYVFSAVVIGRLMDLYSAKVIYGFLGIILFLLLFLQYPKVKDHSYQK